VVSFSFFQPLLYQSIESKTCLWLLQVRVIVGKPIGVEDLLRAAKQNEWSEDALYKAITQVCKQLFWFVFRVL